MLTLFPVILLSIAQSVVALILLAPLPVAQGGISLCKASRTPVGRTFLATLSLFLLILLVPPVSLTESRKAYSRGHILPPEFARAALCAGSGGTDAAKSSEVAAVFREGVLGAGRLA